jgi:hypothetical protein
MDCLTGRKYSACRPRGVTSQGIQISREYTRMSRIHPMNENDEPNIKSSTALLAHGQHTVLQL